MEQRENNDSKYIRLDQPLKHQQSPFRPVRDGESHPMDIKEPRDKNLQVENVDSLKSIDCGDIDPPEKQNLDRSYGDDSTEEDVMESKLLDSKPDSFAENVEKSGAASMKEDDHDDVVGHDKPVEMVQHVELKVTTSGSETVSTLISGNRKFLDKEGVSDNEVEKKVCRWNAEGLKSSEPQSGSITPKILSEPSFKPITGTDSIATVEPSKESVVPPSSTVQTNSLRIDRFLRPFTLKAVQELLGRTGTITSFWMDDIKTHCYVSYSSVEEAVQTRKAVYSLQWPPNGGRLLVAEFVDPQDVKSHMEAPLASPATPSSTIPIQTTSKQPPFLARDRLNLPPPPPLPKKVDPPIVTLDDLFRKTNATPRIYYLPLSDELVAAKLETQGKNVTQ